MAAQVMAGRAVDRLALKQARRVLVLELLPRVEQRRALEKVEIRGEILERRLILDIRADARLVVIFEEAQLVVIRGIRPLLHVEAVKIVAQRAAALQIAVKGLADVVFVFHVEGGKLVKSSAE